MTKLTPKQERFVAEYLIDLNATQAAIRAKYSEKGAEVRGSELLRNRKVADAIAEGKKKIANKLEISAERVKLELARIAFTDMKDYVDFGPAGVTLKELSEMSGDQSRAIAQVEHSFNMEGGGTVKFKLHDKLSALDKLGKHFNLFSDEQKDARPIILNLKF